MKLTCAASIDGRISDLRAFLAVGQLLVQVISFVSFFRSHTVDEQGYELECTLGMARELVSSAEKICFPQ